MPRTDKASNVTPERIVVGGVTYVREDIANATREPSEASQHFADRDIPCTATPKPCEKTFRTTKGRDWHIVNVKHA